MKYLFQSMNNNHSFPNWRQIASVAVICLVGETLLSQPVAPRSLTKDDLLRNIVRDVIAPGYQELASKCHVMTGSLEAFVKTPTQNSLEQAQHAWIEALMASRQIQWVQTGPVADREYLAAFYYAKVLPVRIEEVVNSSRALDDAHFGELGATTKGMFALEYLLFGRKVVNGSSATSPVLELFSPGGSPRRGQYVLALARDLEAKASQLAADWTASGDQSASVKFVTAGQESLNRAVNQLAQLIEQVAEQRINFVLQLQNPISRQLDRIEGSPSGTSQQSTVALLRGIQKIYRASDGGGLENYVKHLNAPIADRVRGQLEAAILATEAIGVPLEQAVPANRVPVQNAYEKTHALEVLCKADLASALGVTITFNSNDGD